MPTYDILVVGELNADLLLAGDALPRFGQVEQLIDDAALVLGSSSAIFACGAARLGLRVGFAGKVGDDALGRFVLAELAARGVDTAGVVVDPAIKTGLSVIFSRPGDRAILTYPGSIAALRRAEIPPALLGAARHLHLGSFFLLDALRPAIPELFATAKARGLTISLDTNYDPAERWDDHLAEALRHVDVFLPNETELLRITGAADLQTARAALGPIPTVAVKLGADGAVGWQGDQEARATPPRVDVVDTTGAGDSFDAGFVYGWLQGWELERALRLGCACGALSTRAAGGTAAQATFAEALALA